MHGMHGEPVPVIDSKDSYLLFGLTVFLHACTFFFLQNVASCFKDYISPLDGVVVTITQDVVPPGKQEGEMASRAAPALKQQQQQQQYNGSRFGSTNSAASYHALHETLDVSVFR